MAEYENLIVERDEMVLVITINRPPANTVSSGTIMDVRARRCARQNLKWIPASAGMTT